MTSDKRGFLFLGIGMLLLMTLVAWLNSDTKDEGEGTPSSYSALRHGGKAAFLLLQQSNYPVERWDKSPADLPADASGVTLIFAGPETHPRPAEFGGIVRFLLHGGRVLIVGAMPDTYVPQGTSEFGDTRIGNAECRAVAATRLTRGGAISQDGDRSWNTDNSSALVHFKDADDKAVVVSYSVGAGQVIWWASALPLTNAGIRDRGNLSLLLNSVGESKRILWDEYYHQIHPSESEHRDNPAQVWALAQVAFFGILLVLTFSRRSGPVVPLVHESRLSPLEFIETLGSVFQRARGAQVAVEIALNRFQQMAARRLGIRSGLSSQDIVLSVAQHGLKLSDDVATLASGASDAASDPQLTEKKALEHVKALVKAMQLLDTQTAIRERN